MEECSEPLKFEHEHHYLESNEYSADCGICVKNDAIDECNLYHNQEIAKKDAEIEDLKFEIQNEQDWQGAIIKEECTKDEIHCPCVPALRKEITKLRVALKFYADGDHFDYDILKQEIITDYGTKAQEALDDK